MVGFGLVAGLVVLVAGVLFMLGLIGNNHVLIGLGLLLLALCAIYGVQPDWPRKRTG